MAVIFSYNLYHIYLNQCKHSILTLKNRLPVKLPKDILINVRNITQNALSILYRKQHIKCVFSCFSNVHPYPPPPPGPICSLVGCQIERSNRLDAQITKRRRRRLQTKTSLHNLLNYPKRPYLGFILYNPKRQHLIMKINNF